jgi:2-polyprenyl-3-methyl-5-hydroxy-6-metoxy-1,4-benzoquinol methylase
LDGTEIVHRPLNHAALSCRMRNFGRVTVNAEQNPQPVGYYNRHGVEFAAQTANVDMEAIYQRFLPHVRTGGRILDAGCGVGRDTLAFADRGYDVVAIDASEEMVRLARERVSNRAAVHLMRFQNIQWRNEFDGI